MDFRHVKACRAGVGPGTIPGVQYKNRRGRFAARTQELLGEDLDEAREADGVLVEKGHDAQTQALLYLHKPRLDHLKTMTCCQTVYRQHATIRGSRDQSAVTKHGTAGHYGFWHYAISYALQNRPRTGAGTATDLKQGIALLCVGMEGLHG